MLLSDGSVVKFPGVYRRVKDNLDFFMKIMCQENTRTFVERPTLDVCTLNKRLTAWADEVSRYSKVDYDISMDALTTLFRGRSEGKLITE